MAGDVGGAVGYFGPAPSRSAHVLVDRPVADATTMATTGPMVASALGSSLGGTYAEAESADQPKSNIIEHVLTVAET